MALKRFLLTALFIAAAFCSAVSVAEAAPVSRPLSTPSPTRIKNDRIVWVSCYGGEQTADAWCCVVYETGPNTVAYACNTLGFLVAVAQDAQYRSTGHAGRCREQQLVAARKSSPADVARGHAALEAAAKAFVTAYQRSPAP